MVFPSWIPTRARQVWRNHRAWMPLALLIAFVLAVPTAFAWPGPATTLIAANVTAGLVLYGARTPNWFRPLVLAVVNASLLGVGLGIEILKPPVVETVRVLESSDRWCSVCLRGLTEELGHACTLTTVADPVEETDAGDEGDDRAESDERAQLTPDTL